jgi:hypothetical protein
MLVTLNKGAEALETDRAVLVRAARNLEPAGGSAKRPLYKLADLARALEQHRAKSDMRRKDDRRDPSPAVQAMHDKLDAMDKAIRKAGSVEKARKLIVPFFKHLAATDAAMRQDVRRSREDRELTGYRCDKHVQTMLWTLREPCGWTFEEILCAYNGATEPEAA